MSKRSDFHDRVVKILFELCKELKTPAGKSYYSSIFADHIGQDYKPIILTAHISKHKPLAKNYYPDIWAQVNGKRERDIYEVWHTETEADAVRDIVFSCLVEGVKYIGIVCTEENLTDDDAEALAHLVNRLSEDEEKKPSTNGTIEIAKVPRELRNDKVKLKKYLKEKLEFK